MTYALLETSAAGGLAGIGCHEDFELALRENWELHGCTHTPLALMLVEIDFFRPFQFACGIVASDQCLDAVAETLLETTRRFGGAVFAYDSGRFAVLLPQAGDCEAQRIADEIHFQIGSLVIDHPRSPVSRAVSVSVGLASINPGHGASREDLEREARAALASACRGGRDRVMRRKALATCC